MQKGCTQSTQMGHGLPHWRGSPGHGAAVAAVNGHAGPRPIRVLCVHLLLHLRKNSWLLLRSLLMPPPDRGIPWLWDGISGRPDGHEPRPGVARGFAFQHGGSAENTVITEKERSVSAGATPRRDGDRPPDVAR